MASLKDVASKAGVSTATVSRVINNHPSVSWDVRRKVHKAMNALSYLPNKSSINLEGKRSGLLGCIVPNLTNPHFSELIMTLEQEARFYGMDLIVKTHSNQPEQESSALHSFIALGIEGLFWVPTEHEHELVDAVQRSGIATVVVTQRSKFFNSFLVDYNNGMRQAAAHIIDGGWTRVGFIGQNTVDLEKYTIFKDAFAILGQPCKLEPQAVFWLKKGIGESLPESMQPQTSHVIQPDSPNASHLAGSTARSTLSDLATESNSDSVSDSNTNLGCKPLHALSAQDHTSQKRQPSKQTESSHVTLHQCIQNIVVKLCQRKEQGAAPIALWAYNDVCALALEQACLKSGLSVPNDVGIISFDNTYIAQILNLTSISQPISQIARLAYQQVAESHRSKYAPCTNQLAQEEAGIECVEIKPYLIARQSTIKNPD